MGPRSSDFPCHCFVESVLVFCTDRQILHCMTSRAIKSLQFQSQILISTVENVLQQCTFLRVKVLILFFQWICKKKTKQFNFCTSNEAVQCSHWNCHFFHCQKNYVLHCKKRTGLVIFGRILEHCFFTLELYTKQCKTERMFWRDGVIVAGVFQVMSIALHMSYSWCSKKQETSATGDTRGVSPKPARSPHRGRCRSYQGTFEHLYLRASTSKELREVSGSLCRHQSSCSVQILDSGFGKKPVTCGKHDKAGNVLRRSKTRPTSLDRDLRSGREFELPRFCGRWEQRLSSRQTHTCALEKSMSSRRRAWCRHVQRREKHSSYGFCTSSH